MSGAARLGERWNLSRIHGALSTLPVFRVSACPRHAKYKLMPGSLPVIELLQPALFSGFF